MRSVSRALVLALAVACGGGGGSSSTGSPSTGQNVLPISVNGALCSAGSYVNKPCVSVTVCVPGTSSCRTVDDVLLDTGSFGLRVFRQALGLDLPPVTTSGASLAECVQFADGSSSWGPVATATVILGGESVQTPIQILDASFGTRPAECSNADATPSAAGFNGILGVGAFAQDCGDACAASANNRLYFACTGGSCSGTAAPLASQVQNPAALLSRDGNGVVVQLPPVPLGGAGAQSGTLVLGIGTQPNNTPGPSVLTYPTNGAGDFRTTVGGSSASGFLDTGSNGLFFTPPSSAQLPDCPSPDAEWFCPTSSTALSATNAGPSGSPSGTVPFTIGNFEQLTRSANVVFQDIGGGSSGASEFDWGLPFHFGRTVFIGFEGRSSPLGTGPLVAY